MDYPAYVQRELAMGSAPQLGSRGSDVRRVQEWLGLHGCATGIDADFGLATQSALEKFQRQARLTETGKVDAATWDALVAPMRRALAVPKLAASATLAATTLKFAQLHLAQHPREVGGDNCGPWVRLYMSGTQGPAHYWCAGFVTFVLRQACIALDRPMPLPGSQSCDSLAYQARERGLFVAGSAIANGSASWAELRPAAIFLVRNTATDWTHTGFAHGASAEVFFTIEGNTNDDGSNNGYEVCARTRSLPKKDFIRLPD